MSTDDQIDPIRWRNGLRSSGRLRCGSFGGGHVGLGDLHSIHLGASPFRRRGGGFGRGTDTSLAACLETFSSDDPVQAIDLAL